MTEESTLAKVVREARGTGGDQRSTETSRSSLLSSKGERGAQLALQIVQTAIPALLGRLMLVGTQCPASLAGNLGGTTGISLPSHCGRAVFVLDNRL